MIGELINDYKVVAALGSGAFGHTYKVEKNEKTFALKLFKPEAINPEISSGGYKRFQTEIKALQKVRSDYTVKYIDDGVWESNNIEHYYLVMEYVAGNDLEKFLKSHRESFVSDESLMKKVFSQILQGLSDMHRLNIIHRDLKPANIFITDDYAIKLLDFGLVKMLDYSSLTTKGKLVGTPLYMSPEIIQGKRPDYRSDLYSFGVILYKIMTSEFPFTGENVFVLIHNILNTYPDKPSIKNRAISNAFENIILKLLEKQPYLRPFQNATELANVLNEITLLHQDIEYSKIEDKSFSKKMFFVRTLHTEKSELLKFFEAGGRIDGVEFPANNLPKYQNQLKDLEKFGIPFYFDPSTNRITYSKFSETKGLVNLPYVYDRYEKLTPNKLSSIAQIQKYTNDVLDWQIKWNTEWIVAPFHYSKKVGDEWTQIDLKLIEEAKRILTDKKIPKELFAGICIDIEAITDDQSRLELVNRFSKILPDGFIFYINSIHERIRNGAQLFSYIDLLLKFKKLKRPIIAARVGTLGLALLYLGIDSFSSGIASLSSFSEETLLSDRPSGYTMERKYYIPQLLSCFDIPKAIEILKSEPSLICNCKFCAKDIGIANLNKVAKVHFLEVRQNEMNEINSKPGVKTFLDKIDRALRLSKSINRRLSGIPSQHFETIKQVFLRVLGENE